MPTRLNAVSLDLWSSKTVAPPAQPEVAARKRSGRRLVACRGLLLLSIATVVLAACGGTSKPAPEPPRIACVYDSTRAYFWERSEFWRDAEAPDARSVVACVGTEATDSVGRTPLHLAAEYDAEPAVLAVLLEHGADTEAKDDYGSTPLHLAVEDGAEPAVLAVLLEHGADTEAKDDFGDTPLHLAVEHSESAIVTTLLEHGADTEAKDDFGDTPLHTAIESNEPAIVTALLDHGANIEGEDDYGNTPLAKAAHRGEPAVITILLDRGANVGDLYWSEPALRQLIDERESKAKPAASSASSGT